MDQAAKAKMRATLAEFAQLTGKSIEDGINEIAMSAGRRLAHTVQPYGLSSAKGDKFIKSVGLQVDRVFLGVNLGAYPATTDIRSAHREQRMRNTPRGNVNKRLFRKEKGKPWLDLISTSEKEQYKRIQQAKAGQAKGAWVSATNQITKANMTGVAAWISRHSNSSYGECRKSGEGMKYKVELENKTPYLPRIQPPKAVAAALTYGLKNGYARIQKVIDKITEKANRQLSK